MADQIVPFQVEVPDREVEELRRRLMATRWPDEIEGAAWTYGANKSVMHEYVRFWAKDYQWRSREAQINALPQFTTEIDGCRIHFVHICSGSNAGRPSVPLLLLHGWPSSFLQMRPLLHRLTTSSSRSITFDLVVPSLPGFGFSSIPTMPGMSAPKIAEIMHRLMTERLGYSRYGLRSSDLGAGIAARIAADHRDSVIGSHTGGTNPWLQNVPRDLSSEEQLFVKNAQAWQQQEMAYAALHTSKPQTLAYGLTDSPAGLAAWLLEKFWRWGDTTRSLDDRYGREALLDNLMLYWTTATINSSMRLYFETARDPKAWAYADVPTAMLMSPYDFFPTPRSWAERHGRVDRWTEIDRGGHFLEWEVPDLVAADLGAFFQQLV